MERDPSSETNTGYAIPDKDELFGDAADRVAVRRPAPLNPRVRRRWPGAWGRSACAGEAWLDRRWTRVRTCANARQDATAAR